MTAAGNSCGSTLINLVVSGILADMSLIIRLIAKCSSHFRNTCSLTRSKVKMQKKKVLRYGKKLNQWD